LREEEAKIATEKEQLSLQTANLWDVNRGWCDEVTQMRSALAYAEHHSSIQVQSDAQSAAALRSELQTALLQLNAETAACRAAHQRQADATKEFTVQLKLMGSRFKEKNRGARADIAA